MKKFGFTLAEVLITLGIIGVVAAVTMPTLVASTKYKQIGVKLSKFASTTENSSRGYVAANTEFGEESALALQSLINYSSEVFRFKKLFNKGTEEDDPNGIPFSAKDSTPLKLDKTYAVQNDDTMLSMFVFTEDSEVASSSDEEKYPKEKFGAPIATFYFDPNIKGLPSTAQHVFAFTFTSKGFLFPSKKDACLRAISSKNWIVDSSYYKKGGVCDKSSGDTWSSEQ